MWPQTLASLHMPGHYVNTPSPMGSTAAVEELCSSARSFVLAVEDLMGVGAWAAFIQASYQGQVLRGLGEAPG